MIVLEDIRDGTEIHYIKRSFIEGVRFYIDEKHVGVIDIKLSSGVLSFPYTPENEEKIKELLS